MRRLAALLVVARRAAALQRPPVRRRMATKPLKAAVEVEEKFAATIEPEALEKRVRELGGEVLRTVEFYDEYFDTEELTLTTRDTWLRRRDGAWELKVPAEARRQATGGETTAFREIEDVPSIAAELASLGVEGFPDDTTLKPFAAFGTRRDKYSLNEVSVDVDAASYGHSIMELEVMTDGSEGDIERARALIAADAPDEGQLRAAWRRHMQLQLASEQMTLAAAANGRLIDQLEAELAELRATVANKKIHGV